MNRNLAVRTAQWLFGVALGCVAGHGQDLTPRAYLITPVNSNAILLTNSFFNGNLMFNGTVPVTDATAVVNAPIVSYYHSLDFFGRSANVTASLPYGVGNFQGRVLGSETSVYRSGLFDSVYRFAVNLKGGPAMKVREFVKYQPKTVIGVSVKVVAPTGQYDPKRLINYGANRWAFKPELGYARRRGHWIFDVYGGIWLYTKNPEFFSRNDYVPIVQAQTQKPITALEGHVSYDVKPRLWISFDANFWFGGKTSLNGVENPATLQRSSRLGVTGSIPLNRFQSVKLSYNKGAYAKFGGNFHNLTVAWQYSWIGRRFQWK